jgi:hypothetical protein
MDYNIVVFGFLDYCGGLQLVQLFKREIPIISKKQVSVGLLNYCNMFGSQLDYFS